MAAQADHAAIEGSGSTWSEPMIDRWIADVAPSGIGVIYTGTGSTAGRKDFAQVTTDFAITEIPYQGVDELGNVDSAGARQHAYVPIVAGGTAFTYHLEQGGLRLTGIRLSGETLAKIFTSQITSWADPAIAADNNGRTLPPVAITPVVRSDGAGSTRQVTGYFDTQYPDVWRRDGRTGPTAYFPRVGARTVAAAGSDQLMNTIASPASNGAIGYVEYSYALATGYPVVKVLNRGGYFVEPTQYNVAVALSQAQFDEDASSPLHLTQVPGSAAGATDPRAYPLSSYSYLILPTGASDPRLTTAKRQSLVDLTFHALCEGQADAGALGYSPLPLNLVRAGLSQLGRLRTADPGVTVSGRDVTSCDNPTFVAGDLTRNHLAEIAPMPAACDQVGQVPCGVSPDELGGGQDGPVRLTLAVPGSPFGSLTMALATPGPVPLDAVRAPDGSVRATGELPPVRVDDTRVDEQLTTWEVNAQVSGFVGATGRIGAQFLGWSPRAPTMDRPLGSALLTQSGAVVASQLDEATSPGLSRSALLGRATAPGRGQTALGAELRLAGPGSTPAGTFTATVTVTLVGG
ncbi:phosphate ABC transporter substrate-binding protein PstS [Cellulomonas sp.]|uniref:phosphate ABC transporter substrate-binding protein PstS n=1 Tax=Cellulomonas sp. TaxID=40001 RepID=UPI003BAB7996